MEVHLTPVELPCGAMTAVHIREKPRSSGALEWVLLTRLPVQEFGDAKQIIAYYLQRWRIEDLFRVSKGGCKVEELRMHSTLRLHRAVTINMVITWRLLLLTLLGREVPNALVELMFTDVQLRVLRNLSAEHDLPSPKDMASAVLLVAMLGGYPPGRIAFRPGSRSCGVAIDVWKLVQPVSHWI